MLKGPQETVRDNKSSSYPVFELPGVDRNKKERNLWDSSFTIQTTKPLNFFPTKISEKNKRTKEQEKWKNYSTCNQTMQLSVISTISGGKKRSIGVKWVSDNTTPCHAHYFKSWNTTNTTKQKNAEGTQQ